MRTLVHLRHGERERGGIHLTPAGRWAAGELGRRLGAFDRVATSPKPRAVETAQAMGCRVDAELAELEELPDALGRWYDRGARHPFGDYVELVRADPGAWAHAFALAALSRSELEKVPDGGRLLLVSHGGIVELGAVGALGAAIVGWGPAVGLLEGVELELDGSGWTAGRPIRQPP